MKAPIIIPKPCHENWDAMDPREKGRHCVACATVVKDYTGMTNEAILESLRGVKGDVCGRVNMHQLTPASSLQRVNFWQQRVVRNFLYGVAGVVTFGFFFRGTAKAQVMGRMPVKGKMNYQPQENKARKLTVIIRSAYGNGLLQEAIVSIFSGGSRIRRIGPGHSGQVELSFEAGEISGGTISIRVEAVGHITKNIHDIALAKDQQTMELVMEDEMVMMGVIYIPPPTDSTQDQQKDTVITGGEFPAPQSPQEKTCIPEATEPDTTGIMLESLELKIASAEKSRYNAYPVPAVNELTIESDDDREFSVEIYNSESRRIHTIHHIVKRHTVSVERLSPGIYYALFLVNGAAVETKKLIVSRH